MSKGDIYNMCILFSIRIPYSLLSHFYVAYVMVLMSTEFQGPMMGGSSVRLKQVEENHVTLRTKYAGGTDGPQRPHFPFKPELASNRERRPILVF